MEESRKERKKKRKRSNRIEIISPFLNTDHRQVLKSCAPVDFNVDLSNNKVNKIISVTLKLSNSSIMNLSDITTPKILGAYRNSV